MPENAMRVNAEATTGRGAEGDKAVLVYATFPDQVSADAIAGEIVAAGLAACANLLPGMRSVYRWQGAIQRDEEIAAIFKTRGSLAPRLVGWLRIAHPYVNPAAVVIPVAGGSDVFLAWIANETTLAIGV